MKSHTRFGISIAGALFTLTTFALAGPPMVCHKVEIGNTKTLPWVDLNYHKGNGGYDLNHLTADTLAILDSDSSVLVHMETLRRATIYARQDSQVAKQLITRLHARTDSSNAALAWFDLGYLAETYKQWFGKGEPNPAIGVDGYAFVTKAIAMRGADPEMEFAAALITLTTHQADHDAHVEKAIGGAKSDSLLAQNLDSRFHDQTIAAMLTNPKE
jgi:hypothetical protein